MPKLTVAAVDDRESTHRGAGDNVTFAGGSYSYLVGAGYPATAADARRQAQGLAAATTLYRRVHQLH